MARTSTKSQNRERHDKARPAKKDETEYVVFLNPIPENARWQEVKDIAKAYGIHARNSETSGDYHEIGFFLVPGRENADRAFDEFCHRGWHGRKLLVSLTGPVYRREGRPEDWFKTLGEPIRSATWSNGDPNPRQPRHLAQMGTTRPHSYSNSGAAYMYGHNGTTPMQHNRHDRPPQATPYYRPSTAVASCSGHNTGATYLDRAGRESEWTGYSRPIYLIAQSRHSGREKYTVPPTRSVLPIRPAYAPVERSRSSRLQKSNSRRQESVRHSSDKQGDEPMIVNGALGRIHRNRDDNDD